MYKAFKFYFEQSKAQRSQYKQPLLALFHSINASNYKQYNFLIHLKDEIDCFIAG